MTASIWNPYWTASTAYVVPAVVIPTSATFAGYTWRCTTPGTTGLTEPVWPDPTLGTTTVTDGTVVWSVGTGFRQAIQYGIYNLVQTFATANPTVIRSVRTVRPPSFEASTSLPVFFIGDLNETITHANGIRTRIVSGFSCYLVDAIGTITDSNDRMNFAADVLTDLFTLNYHAINGTSIFQQTGTADFEFPDPKGGPVFPALEFTFAETEIAEGRT
jgi:hypothetical protein